jgi:hypothetical protein
LSDFLRAYANVPEFFRKDKFDLEFSKKKDTFQRFLPHCIRLLTYPTGAGDGLLTSKQDSIRRLFLHEPIFKNFIDSTLLKTIIEKQEEELKKYYEGQIQVALANAELQLANHKSTATPPPAVIKINAAQKKELEDAKNVLTSIIGKFKEQLFNYDRWIKDKVTMDAIVQPKEIEKLLKRINDCLAEPAIFLP